MTGSPDRQAPKETVEVRLDGLATRLGGLAWGQLAIRRSMLWLRGAHDYFNVSGTIELPLGISLDAVTEAIGVLMERHQGLRTVFPGWSGPEPVQHVLGAVRLSVRLVDATGSDADDVGRPVLQQLARVAFDHETELPVRAAVVMRDSRPVRLLLVVSHLSVDGSAWRVLRSDLERLLQGRDLAERPTATAGPLDLVQMEASDSGLRRERSALRRWESALDAAAVLRDVDATPESPRFRGLYLESTVVARSAEAVARRTGLSTSVVLLAGLLRALAVHVAGQEVAVVVITSNRSRPGTRDLVAPMAQNGVAVMSTGGGEPFDTHAASVGDAVVDAVRSAQYDVRRLDELVAERRRRGLPAELPGVYFNDVRPGGWPGLVGREDLVGCDVPASTLSDTGGWDSLDLEVFFEVHPDPEKLRLLVQLDTTVVGRDEGVALLARFEDEMVRAGSA
ncbi:condensation domain-containing protein [Cellulosimicrobium protaetiae]|uniref:Condensation domain-containing protein n=1 Tax=Cellulosimicrobium protaetiae TaxID=2587808 RepID=A0A6M5UBP2_9MICO|nr:condensation domain-containing protein [Cellulosimicrobium protaetiae]QJW34851.1 hypothetical protein FIC82_000175 [Cellulosimicrobium protaetiae]